MTPVLVNGLPGVLVDRDGVPVSVMGFAFRGGQITRVQILLDPKRLTSIDFGAFKPPGEEGSWPA